jgi:hypothetical protein
MSFGVRFDLQSPWHNCVKMLHVADGGYGSRASYSDNRRPRLDFRFVPTATKIAR